MSAESTTSERIRRLLADPHTYGDGTSRVDVVETHISQVFLTERFVYKLKKPVRFEFVDFSTAEHRAEACREEVRLNRRLAPLVYLGVRPIVESADGRLMLASDDARPTGTVVDRVVVMRRLPADRMLDALWTSGRLTAADADRLIEYLAEYYARAEPLDGDPHRLREACRTHVRANLDDLLRTDAAEERRVRRIHTPQLLALLARPEWFDRRAAAGRVIDGHGDLRPEHVCLIDPPAVFDCVEFNADLRRVDALDELCFLAMECDRLGARDLGRRCIDAYRRRAADDAPAGLETFYKTYRASVRAKVAALRAAQLSHEEAESQRRLCREYLALAEQYVHDAGARPTLFIVCGLMGSGKSTLARDIAERSGSVLLRTDVVRNEIQGAARETAGFGQGRYSAEARRRVYEATLDRAADLLTDGVSVVVDGTFTQASLRREASARAEAAGARVIEVRCVCPRDVSLERIRRRRAQTEPDASEARPELYDAQAAEWETGPDTEDVYEAETTREAEVHLRAVFERRGSPFARD